MYACTLLCTQFIEAICFSDKNSTSLFDKQCMMVILGMTNLNDRLNSSFNIWQQLDTFLRKNY